MAKSLLKAYQQTDFASPRASRRRVTQREDQGEPCIRRQAHPRASTWRRNCRISTQSSWCLTTHLLASALTAAQLRTAPMCVSGHLVKRNAALGQVANQSGQNEILCYGTALNAPIPSGTGDTILDTFGAEIICAISANRLRPEVLF